MYKLLLRLVLYSESNVRAQYLRYGSRKGCMIIRSVTLDISM